MSSLFLLGVTVHLVGVGRTGEKPLFTLEFMDPVLMFFSYKQQKITLGNVNKKLDGA